MTVTYLHLASGATLEPFDLSLKAYLERDWDSDNCDGVRPTINASSGSENNLARDDESEINMINLEYDSRMHEKEDEENSNGDSMHKWSWNIRVNPISEDVTKLALIEEEFNRIIWENCPSPHGTRWKQSDLNTNSEIDHFFKTELDFERLEPDDPDEDPRPSSQAFMKAIFYKFKN